MSTIDWDTYFDLTIYVKFFLSILLEVRVSNNICAAIFMTNKQNCAQLLEMIHCFLNPFNGCSWENGE